MSEMMRDSAAEAADAEPDADGVLRHRIEQRRLGAPRPTLTVVHDAPATLEPVALPEAPSTDRAAYLADLELQLRELAEIERMRDLEIHRLEADVERQSTRITELETALFHADRRANDLDRRWNELAEVYEATADALVRAGGQLEAIHDQPSYRLMLTMSRALRRRPAMYELLQRLTGRIVRPSAEH